MTVETWHAYDELGDEYVRRTEQSAYNAHYDRPNTLAALRRVEGLAVLDAGCGPGVYAGHLVESGAVVVGFDASSAMVDRARARLGTAASIDQLRLDELLPYPDEAFDRVLCALAIPYSNDRELTLTEFFRILKPGGRAILSTQHPTEDWLRKGGSYFATQRETDIWTTADGEVEVTFWREPLSALCTAATRAGFLIDLIDEPLPAPSMEQFEPETFKKLSERPGFLIVGLSKPKHRD